MNKKILQLLYRSFDDELSPKEQQRLEAGLAASKELREEKARIEALRSAVVSNVKKSFHPFFAEKVMQRIQIAARKEETFFEALLAIFRPVIIATAIILIALISYNVLKSDSLSVSNVIAGPEVTLDYALDPSLYLTME